MSRWNVAGAPNNPNGSVTNWCNPNGVVKAVFSLDKGDKGSANILSLNPASNKNELSPADQATRQPAALDRRRISTPHSPSDNPHRIAPSRRFWVPKLSGSPNHCVIPLLLPSLASRLTLSELPVFCVQVACTGDCALSRLVRSQYGAEWGWFDRAGTRTHQQIQLAISLRPWAGRARGGPRPEPEAENGFWGLPLARDHPLYSLPSPASRVPPQSIF